MSDVKPILFSGPMVRALLEGRKTQTRRVLTKLRRFGNVREFGRSDTAGYDWHFRDKDARWHDLRHAALLQYLPFAPGDLLWVRETWSGDYWLKDAPPSERPQICAQVAHVPKIPRTWYWADGSPTHGDWERPRPSIHMPRWASRLTLEVTSVKVERLQEISADDALAEGVIRQDPTPEDEAWNRQWCEGEGIEADPLEPVWLAPGTRQGFGSRPNDPQWGPTPEFAFRLLWDSPNAKRGYGWDTNPWGCAISFIVHRTNVDAFLAQREAA